MRWHGIHSPGQERSAGGGFKLPVISMVHNYQASAASVRCLCRAYRILKDNTQQHVPLSAVTESVISVSLT